MSKAVPPAPAASAGAALDPTGRFGARAQAYARARPGYPAEAVRELARRLGLPPGATVVDLGCGTGLSSEAFLRAGWAVIGVEPNAPMRAHAQALAADWPDFTLVDGRAEDTGLPQGCADLVVAAQAFHWFDVPAARAEALRILRRPAMAALVWNDRVAEGSDFLAGYEALLRRYSPDYLEIRHRHERTDRIEQFFGHARWQILRTAHADELDFETLAERLNSASYVPAPGSAQHPAMLAELQALFARTQREGRVVMAFETRIFHGEIGA
jgi:SAM-dependent methyltransferase